MRGGGKGSRLAAARESRETGPSVAATATVYRQTMPSSMAVINNPECEVAHAQRSAEPDRSVLAGSPGMKPGPDRKNQPLQRQWACPFCDVALDWSRWACPRCGIVRK